MADSYMLLTPLLMLGVVALLGFVGCNALFGLEHVPDPLPGPTNLVALPGDGRVDLSWDAYIDATEYYVKRGTTSGVYDVNTPVPAGRTTFGDMQVTNNTTYFYVVSARVGGQGGNRESNNSAETQVTPVATAVPSEYFITGKALGQLGSHSGYAGMEIEVGPNAIRILALGRLFAPGNVAQHTLKIIEKTTVADVVSVKLDTVGGTDGQFQYIGVPSPVTLNANARYYVVSSEVTNLDRFYQDDTTVQTTAAATVVNSVYGDGVSPYTAGGTPNHTFGPLDFQYSIVT